MAHDCICIVVPAEVDAARLNKSGTAQGFRLANLARIFINLSWYDSIIYIVLY